MDPIPLTIGPDQLSLWPLIFKHKKGWITPVTYQSMCNTFNQPGLDFRTKDSHLWAALFACFFPLVITAFMPLTTATASLALCLSLNLSTSQHESRDAEWQDHKFCLVWNRRWPPWKAGRFFITGAFLVPSTATKSMSTICLCGCVWDVRVQKKSAGGLIHIWMRCLKGK